MRILPALSERENLPSYRRYLAGDRRAMKCYQLSHKIAEVFDRYLVFRPELILRWDAGEAGDDWQGNPLAGVSKGKSQVSSAGLRPRSKVELRKRKAPLRKGFRSSAFEFAQTLSRYPANSRQLRRDSPFPSSSRPTNGGHEIASARKKQSN